MPTKRPLVFVDLDDTLFQTARKMDGAPRFMASLESGVAELERHDVAQYELVSS